MSIMMVFEDNNSYLAGVDSFLSGQCTYTLYFERYSDIFSRVDF